VASSHTKYGSHYFLIHFPGRLPLELVIMPPIHEMVRGIDVLIPVMVSCPLTTGGRTIISSDLSALGYRPPAPEALMPGYAPTSLTLSVVQ